MADPPEAVSVAQQDYEEELERRRLHPQDAVEDGTYETAIRRSMEGVNAAEALKPKHFREMMMHAPRYAEEKASVEFREHLKAIRWHFSMWSCFNGAQRKLVLYHSIQGRSKARVAHLGVTCESFDTMKYREYEALIEEVFHPRSEVNLARAEFISRKQGAAEDVSAYISHKFALFESATGASASAEFNHLLEETVAGLYSVDIQRKVWDRMPTTPEELRKAILRVVGLERIAFTRGWATVASLDGLMSVTSAQQIYQQRRLAVEATGRPEPMEVDQIAAMQSGRTAGNARGAAAKFRGRCYLCNQQGHLKRDCPRGKRGNDGAAAGSSGSGGKMRCHWCGKLGHVMAKCRAKQAGKPRVRLQQLDGEEDEPEFGELSDAEIEAILQAEEEQAAAASSSVNMLGGSGFRRGRHC